MLIDVKLIQIGDDITVTVLSIDHNQVRIGVKAPKDVRVDREEVRWRMDHEQVTT